MARGGRDLICWAQSMTRSLLREIRADSLVNRQFTSPLRTTLTQRAIPARKDRNLFTRTRSTCHHADSAIVGEAAGRRCLSTGLSSRPATTTTALFWLPPCVGTPSCPVQNLLYSQADGRTAVLGGPAIRLALRLARRQRWHIPTCPAQEGLAMRWIDRAGPERWRVRSSGRGRRREPVCGSAREPASPRMISSIGAAATASHLGIVRLPPMFVSPSHTHDGSAVHCQCFAPLQTPGAGTACAVPAPGVLRHCDGTMRPHPIARPSPSSSGDGTQSARKVCIVGGSCDTRECIARLLPCQ